MSDVARLEHTAIACAESSTPTTTLAIQGNELTVLNEQQTHKEMD